MRKMEELKLSVKALAAIMDMSIEELATNAHLDYTHLKSVSSGRTRMTAEDLQNLSNYTGIPADNIKV